MANAPNLTAEPGAMRVWAYPRALRLAAGGLLLVSAASLPFLSSRVLLADDPPMSPAMVLRAFVAISLLPALAALLVRRALVATLRIAPDALEIGVGGQSFTVPLASIGAVEPWRVPLPQPGLGLRLGSGQRFALGLAAEDPSIIVARLVEVGVEAAAPALDRPPLVYARVKHAAGRLGWRRLVAKFPLFGALVAGVLFNAHQHIAYGGTFGQYYLEGALPYAKAFATYWVTVTIYLVLYASVWRWPAEIVAWLAARRGDSVASPVRRAVELVCRLAYYAGVPLLLALRFAQ
jgi:apolipoprotein N-acyltransferase